MTPQLAIALASILAQYGLPLAHEIWTWTQGGKQVTEADWELLNKLAAYRSTDALTAAGIKIENGVVVKLDGSPLVVP